MYECRDERYVFAELAARLGINDYYDKTEDKWLRDLTKDAVEGFKALKEAVPPASLVRRNEGKGWLNARRGATECWVTESDRRPLVRTIYCSRNSCRRNCATTLVVQGPSKAAPQAKACLAPHKLALLETRRLRPFALLRRAPTCASLWSSR